VGTPSLSQGCTYVAPAPAPAPVTPPPSPNLPGRLGAFPGCEGSGCDTRGGFATSQGTPKVYRVTSLASGTGAGTLGQCIAASGPRVCMFAVSGTIRTSGYTIANPYITIDGGTAPGAGIQLTGEGQSPNGQFLHVRTHDVVVRGLKMRPGWTRNSGGGDVVTVFPSSGASVHHVVIDHNSFQYSSDEHLGVSTENGAATQPSQMTLSNNVFAEALDRGDGQSMGLLVNGYNGLSRQLVGIDIHHNYFASNKFRNPLFFGHGRIVNNVIYNWQSEGVTVRCAATADVVNNLAKRGPATTKAHAYETMDTNNESCDVTGQPSVYLAGNKLNGAEVGWGSSGVREYGASTHRNSPQVAPTSGPAITAQPADALMTSVLGSLGAGASYRLDCGGRRVANRDSRDQRIVDEWTTPAPWNNAADTIAEWGGYPVIASVSSGTVCSATSRDNANCACADSDADGMPDYWERAFCGSTTGCSALGTTVAAPWTNLEAFMSGSKEAP
jgi:pectate lyase